MCIAFNADFGQMHQCDIASVVVYHVRELFCQSKKGSPLFLAGVYGRLLRNVVTIIDENWNSCELHEVCHRYAWRYDGTTGKFYAFSRFTFRENEITTRLKGNNCLDITVLDRRPPARTTAL